MCSCGDSELDRSPIPIRSEALLVLWLRRPGELTAIGDVSRRTGGGPGGGGGIVCTFGRRVGVLREWFRGEAMGLAGAASSGEG